ncbi:SusC/RagA family TonB-linked outer membrane protein [Mucilaginibacter conchicola]|uniref:SusC/RagA family TonB-linked outer membrane protein n=1 Tax=Mucilaginibacter conchicola TaxID=2303333 RepID=A0A372NN89_9SPHI|nr:SusC/RagA family TonB-linked outer membrane protein [Mucilaginibacter conchicola]RFZ90399.1 SusC/RagA family TonB-linked outer membrane protein [Mucilaginibacter conchicola]
MKQLYLRCTAVLFFSLMTIVAYAQKTVTGRVTEKSGQAAPGVNVTEKGTTHGTTTDINGKFSLSGVKPGAVLTFSFIGFKTQEITVGEGSTINVVIESGESALNEVVVTALGIKREKKSLGYAVQEVKGAVLTDRKETNVVNALSGQVAGLQITKSGNGPGGSSRITLRGNNSLTGTNQPLIVVDGVPIDNFTGNEIGGDGKPNNDYFNPTRDMGNGLADINPEDIESMSVLKGPSAAALYGSRAGNGAILITTKTGKSQNGLGITVTSSFGFESIFSTPKMQTQFGQGESGGFVANSTSSWGEENKGQTQTRLDGTTFQQNFHDNVKNYFQTGLQSLQGISFQQQYKSTSVYTSYNRLDDKSYIPGAKLIRNNLTARTVSKFGTNDKWTVDTKVQYINSTAQNRPQSGYNPNNYFYYLQTMPNSIDVTGYSNPLRPDGKMNWWHDDQELNPYWAAKYNLNEDVRDRFLLNASIKYQFNNWLSFESRGGADIYNTTTINKTYGGSPSSVNGSYGERRADFTETNYSGLLTAKKDNLIGKWGGVLTVGGNLMNQQRSFLSASAGTLNVPNLFAINNAVGNPGYDQGRFLHNIYSVYGSLGINYDQVFFVDGTARNDWSSALSKANRSYFYPSVSTSLVFSEMLNKNGSLPSWITYGKIRGSYAVVGNDMDPYQLYNTYTISKDPLGNTTAGRKGTLYDENVKSELIKSYEAGLEMRFFDSRLGFDFAVYKTNATNQLLDIPMDPLSGYSYRKVNAGNIQNKGLELMVDGKILRNADGFNWNTMVNFSINRNKVLEITKEITVYPLPGGTYDNVSIIGQTGQLYGAIYGSSFRRVTDANSPYKGQLVLTSAGLPQTTDGGSQLLGNQQASSLLGVTNSFSYKGFNFSFLVDARFGGKIFSSTLSRMERSGTSANTVVNGKRENFTVDGVILNTTTNQYEKNTISVTPQQYWTAVTSGNQGITEANLYDASNIRLRNVNISYDLSKSLLSGTGIQRARIGVSANNVWLIKSHMMGLDPESVFATGSNATGYENGSAPTVRTILLNLTLGF